jgi:rhomboid protease GlpG
MRLIGHLPNEASALTFSDFLYVQGIHNQIEHEHDGWGIWIHSEDEIDKAKDLLKGFAGNPNDPRFHKHSRRASQIKEQEIKEDQAAKEKTFDRSTIFKSTMPYGVGALTVLFMALSVGASGLAFTNPDAQIFELLKISNYRSGLREVMTGEIWRLFTPALLHGGWLHLFFNMWWLLDLGSMIEGRQSSRSVLALVLVIGILSNLTQWYFAGPNFVGMSGVVYGLLGYIWMRSKYDPSSGLFLHSQTVLMMLIWFFACWFVIPGVANYAHTGGLVVGMAWGLISSFWARHR